MFVNAIEHIQHFTRPVHSILRHFHSNFIQPGAATLFFVNENSEAITCNHVLQQLLQEHTLNTNFENYKAEKKALGTKIDGKYKRQLKELELKYNYQNADAVAQLKNNLVNCTDSSQFDYIPHPTLDIAILKFKNVTQKYYNSYATFLKDGSQVKQGKYLCRFGFPFAEFNNYEYDTINDNIFFTKTGNLNSPSFPIEGMVTRHVSDGQKIVGIEMSTPGLRGQSGGPLFDTNGIVYGMQSVTVQYHMKFDEQLVEIITKGKKTSTVNNSFLNVGRCVHADEIKSFLIQNNIKFYES